MRRFYIDISLQDKEKLVLPKEESRHIAKVLRMEQGQLLEIINGKGDLLIGEIMDTSAKAVQVKKKNYTFFPPDDEQIHIAIAPTKKNDRMEWFLEKSTELGIHEITPLLCSNSERKKINLDRFQRILVAATKQSKRYYIPRLNPLTKLEDFIEEHPQGFLAHCYKDKGELSPFYQVFKTAFKNKSTNSPVLIGPEGDFTLNEVDKILQKQYHPITLGKTRLRTETAGVYACAIQKMILEEK